jgi:hypothetical protein
VLKRIHPVAGGLAFLIILSFWTSTVAVELFGSPAAIAAVKRAIPWGLLVLVPSLAVVGASGFRMAGTSSAPLVLRKKRRMPFIAANGLLILIPAALYLATLASQGDFGGRFYAVQAVELIAGAVNLTLMGLNIRDGLRLAGRLR